MRAEDLFDAPVDRAELLLLTEEIFLRTLDDYAHQEESDKSGPDHGEGEDIIRVKHHDDGSEELRHRADELPHASIHRDLDEVHVIRGARKGVAIARRVEISERHPVDLQADIAPKTTTDTLSDRRHNKALRIAENHGEAIHHDERHTESHRLLDVDADGRAHAVQDGVRDLLDEIRTEDRKHGSPYGKEQDRDKRRPISLAVSEQTHDRPFHTLRLLCDVHPAHMPSSRRRPSHCLSFFIHWTVPPPRAGTRRSRDTLSTWRGALCASRSPLLFLRPKPRFYPRP